MSLAYALVSPDDQIIERRLYPDGEPPAGNLGQVAASKPRLVPVETVGFGPFNPVTQVRTGPVVTIEPTRVIDTYTVRAKTEEEVEAEYITPKLALLETEYRRRNALPIVIEVDGVERTWHADPEAIENVTGILVLLANDVPVTDPRPWKPYEADIITVSNAGFKAIGAGLALRKDVNFVILQTLKATLRATSDDPAAADAFDPLDGWD